ncbi:MAG TPA: GYF domain-containing protein [Polyangiaceae bacterium]|nr:GYF domain-containing protein [Polyangiaceae bacterium]
MKEPSPEGSTEAAPATRTGSAARAAGAFSASGPSSWYVCQGGKTEGPLREERIVQLIQWGKISARAYICDEQLSSWVSIRRTAFAALLQPQTPAAPGRAEPDANPLGALRGGPWRLSTRAAQRLSGLLAALSVAAGALQLASGLSTSSQSDELPPAASAPGAAR